jgi:hypothetical protein
MAESSNVFANNGDIEAEETFEELSRQLNISTSGPSYLSYIYSSHRGDPPHSREENNKVR